MGPHGGGFDVDLAVALLGEIRFPPSKFYFQAAPKGLCHRRVERQMYVNEMRAFNFEIRLAPISVYHSRRLESLLDCRPDFLELAVLDLEEEG